MSSHGGNNSFIGGIEFSRARYTIGCSGDGFESSKGGIGSFTGIVGLFRGGVGSSRGSRGSTWMARPLPPSSVLNQRIHVEGLNMLRNISIRESG
jgi:hypothetical protein